MIIKIVCAGYYEFTNQQGVRGVIRNFKGCEYRGLETHNKWIVETDDSHSDLFDSYKQAKHTASLISE